jgi:hypothetical protein
LTATANGILVAAATNDAAALASLLNDLVEAVRR